MSGVCWAQPPQHSHTVRGTGCSSMPRARRHSPYDIPVFDYICHTAHIHNYGGTAQLEVGLFTSVLIIITVRYYLLVLLLQGSQSSYVYYYWLN